MENKNLTKTFREEASKIIEETFLQIKEKYKQLVDLGHSYGLEDLEIDLILQDLLKPKVSPKTLYNYRREYLQLENISVKVTDIYAKKDIEQSSNSNQYAIPQTPPNIVDVGEFNEPYKPEPVQPPQQERRTPEAPDNSMVEQLHIINIGLKKDVERLMDENIRLKQENQELKAELGRHRRLEELRLEAQRKAIKEWRNPGHKP